MIIRSGDNVCHVKDLIIRKNKTSSVRHEKTINVLTWISDAIHTIIQVGKFIINILLLLNTLFFLSEAEYGVPNFTANLFSLAFYIHNE